MKSYIGSSPTIYNDRRVAKKPFVELCVGPIEVSASSMSGGSDGEFEVSNDLLALKPELTRARRWKICDLHEKEIFSCDSDYTDVTNYLLDVNTHELQIVPNIHKDAYAFVAGWIAVWPSKKKRVITCNEWKTEFIEMETGRSYCFPYQVEVLLHIQNSDVLVCIEDRRGLPAQPVEYKQARMNISTGEFVWEKNRKGGRERLVSNQIFCNYLNQAAGFYKFSDGSKVRSFGLKKIKLDLPRVVDGVFYAVNRGSGEFYEYNANTDTETIWQVGDGQNSSFITVAGNELVVHDFDSKRLKIFSLTENKFIVDKPFYPEIFVPRECENSNDFVCRTGDPIRVYRTDTGYAFSINERGDMHLSDIERVYLFDLDELDQEEIVVDREEFSCQYDRLLREDGDSEYRIWFDQAEPFQKLLRHADTMSQHIYSNFGSSSYPDAKTDRQWMGLIRIDLTNQSLNEEQRWIFERLPVQLKSRDDFQFRSGVDWDQRMEFQIEFADD